MPGTTVGAAIRIVSCNVSYYDEGLVLPLTGEDERCRSTTAAAMRPSGGLSAVACRGTRSSRGPLTEASCAAMTLVPASTFFMTWIVRRYVGGFGLLPPPHLARLAAHFRGCIRRPGNWPRYDGKSSRGPQGGMAEHGWG